MKLRTASLATICLCAVTGCAKMDKRTSTTDVFLVGVVGGFPATRKSKVMTGRDITVGGKPVIVQRNALGKPIRTKYVTKIETTITDDYGEIRQKVFLGPEESVSDTAEAKITAHSPVTYTLVSGWIYVWDHDLYVETDTAVAHVIGSSMVVRRLFARDAFYLLDGSSARVTLDDDVNDFVDLGPCQYVEVNEDGFLGDVQAIPDCPCPYDTGTTLGQFLNGVCELMSE